MCPTIINFNQSILCLQLGNQSVGQNNTIPLLHYIQHNEFCLKLSSQWLCLHTMCHLDILFILKLVLYSSSNKRSGLLEKSSSFSYHTFSNQKLEGSYAGRWLWEVFSLQILIIDACTNLLHKNTVRKSNALTLVFL